MFDYLGCHCIEGTHQPDHHYCMMCQGNCTCRGWYCALHFLTVSCIQCHDNVSHWELAMDLSQGLAMHLTIFSSWQLRGPILATPSWVWEWAFGDNWKLKWYLHLFYYLCSTSYVQCNYGRWCIDGVSISDSLWLWALWSPGTCRYQAHNIVLVMRGQQQNEILHEIPKLD